MIAVLDASVGIEVALRRPRYAEFTGGLVEAEWVIAPDLYVVEVTNSLWKYRTVQNMPVAECEAALERGISLPDDMLSARDLAAEAFALACLTRRPVYDMLYLILARRNNAVLFTLDTSLRKTARAHSIKVLGA